MKVCRKCGIKKTMSEFYKHEGMRDGHLNKCRTCAKAVNTRYRNIKLGRTKKPVKYTTRKYHETAKGGNMVYRKYIQMPKPAINPEKVAAQRKLNYAILMGRVVKCPCEECGELKVHGCHEDFSRPYDVHWLCVEHSFTN